MMKMKKMLGMLLAVMLCFSLCACGGGSGADSDASADGKVEVTWWTSYSQENMGYVKEMVNNFNNSQDKYQVTLVNQGSISEIRTKLAGTKQENLPSLFNGQPITTGYYASSSFTAPIQDFLDADEDKWYDEIYDVVRTSYSDLDGNVIGAPCGVSCAGWFVNVDLVKQAGYSMEQITNFEILAEVATAIKTKGLADYGIVFGANGVDLFDTLTLQGVDILDEDNGYSGEATKCIFGEGETAKALDKTLKIYGELYKNEVALTYGSDTNGEKVPQFAAGNLGFFYATNSYAQRILLRNPEFEFTFIPSVPTDANGTYIGQAMSEGTGNYICNTGNEEEMQGAYELIKFICKAENQSYFAQNTGYVPYTEAGYNQEDYQTWMTANFPAAAKVKEMLLSSAKDLRGPYTSIPNALLSACGNLYSDIALDPTGNYSDFIQSAIEQVDEAIEIQALRK